jgi:hypothetical protein
MESGAKSLPFVSVLVMFVWLHEGWCWGANLFFLTANSLTAKARGREGSPGSFRAL